MGEGHRRTLRRDAGGRRRHGRVGRGGISLSSDNPLIVQSDHTALLEVGHPLAEACRAGLARFAELEKSPEHIHTYRITPLSLWNARAAGMSAEEITEVLRTYSRYAVPASILVEIADQVARYGRLRLSKEDDTLVLSSSEPAVLEEVLRSKKVSPLVGPRLDAGRVSVPTGERGRLKHALIKIGWPVEDLAGYSPGAPLPFALLGACAGSGAAFALRRFQVEAVDSFWAAGKAAGGSGVVVLPCGAGKTVVAMGVMEKAATQTLILVTSIVAARQWKSELLDKTDLTEEQIGEYSGETKTIRPVTIATYQVMTHRRKGQFPHLALFQEQNWGLIVYDEVHLLPAPVFRMTADIQSKRRLGLTATLVREDRREDDVFSLIGPKRYDAPWRDLEAQGWIAPAVCTEVRVGVPEYLRFEYATAEGQDRYRVAATNPAKMSVLRALVERHASDRVLVIGQYLDQLDDVAAALSAPLITGKTPTAEREKLYAAFREGSIRLLVVSKVANFSIDLPEANVAIQISGTFGSRQEEAQRLGRILRPKAGGGQASFYTLVSRETQDQEFALHRQLFLAEQGYRYSIVDAAQVIGGEPLPPPPPQGEYLPAVDEESAPVVRPPGYVPAAPLPDVLPDNVIPFRASRGK
ncbi:MAG: excision repair protein [Actinomycetota bacterium]|nr:excision repair protein [Actinomycetota bacterium]